MSTATTLKRVALVAVYALGFGLMSVAPSQAVVNSDSLSLSSATATHTLGSGEATVTATIGFLAGAVNDTVRTSVAVTSAPAGNAALPTWKLSMETITATQTVDVVDASGFQVASSTAGIAGLRSVTGVISLTPLIAGTYIVTVSQSVEGVVTRSTTWTVTSAAPALGKADAFISNLSGFLTSGALAADTGTLTAPATAATGAVARIEVDQWANAAGTVALGSDYTSAVSVSVSGAGAVGTVDSATVRGASAATAAAGAASQNYFLFADGRSGPATITIAVGGTTVATKTFTFVGSAAAAVVDTTTLLANIGVGEFDTITYNAVDAAGNKTGVNTALDFGVSSDTTVATISVVDGIATVTALKVGTTNITVCNTANCTAATVSSVAQAITVRGLALGKVTMTLDKASYAPGEKMTLTVSAVDTSTTPLALADGTRTLFSTAPVINVSLGSGSDALPGTAVALVNGSKTYTLYAPLGSGTINITAADATTAKAAVSVSAVVSNPAQEAADAATDAALEAIDAANAATDAANLAAEAADAATVAAEEARDAADAATAAVEALAAEVTTMIAEIKAQLTALANVVAKIARKVKA